MPRRIHLIANPKGGVGDNEGLARRAGDFLGGHQIASTLYLTEYAGHARKIVAELETGEGDSICGVGGDGTMNELVNGLMAREPAARVPLTLLPGGTGNSLLHDLGCLDPDVVLGRIVAGSRRSIDLFEVSVAGARHYGFNIVGWGLLSSANQLAERLRWLGRRRYDVAAFLQLLRARRYRGSLEVDGETIDGGFMLLAASNTAHTGEGMRLTPGARLDDGKLELVYLRDAGRIAMLRMFAKLGKGQHLGEPGVSSTQVSGFKLTTTEPQPLNLDGELIESGSFEVHVLPGALEMLI